MLSATEARTHGLGAVRGIVIALGFALGFDAAVAAVIWWIVK